MNYSNTRIYGVSLELVKLAHEIIEEFPAGFGFLADQLRRASASIPLNFAEGHDKGSRAEEQRVFRIARCSAQEVAAILDVALRLGAMSPERHAAGAELCDHLVRMLFRFRR